jgi:hypothetical protein
MREHRLEAKGVHGLREVVESAEPQGLDRGVHRRHAGDDHHVGRGRLAKFPEQSDAVAIGQEQVDHDEVVWIAGDQLACFLERARSRDGETLLRGDLDDAC